MMRGLRGVNLQNAYGTPFWLGPRGRGMGDGDTITTLDPSMTVPVDPSATITNPGNYYPGLSPATGGSPSWLPVVQTGVQDVFNFAKLFNPVPPGTVMMTGPNGQQYVARAAAGAATPSAPFNFSGAGTAAAPIIVVSVVILAIIVFGRGK